MSIEERGISTHRAFQSDFLSFFLNFLFFLVSGTHFVARLWKESLERETGLRLHPFNYQTNHCVSFHILFRYLHSYLSKRSNCSGHPPGAGAGAGPASNVNVWRCGWANLRLCLRLRIRLRLRPLNFFRSHPAPRSTLYATKLDQELGQDVLISKFGTMINTNAHESAPQLSREVIFRTSFSKTRNRQTTYGSPSRKLM